MSRQIQRRIYHASTTRLFTTTASSPTWPPKHGTFPSNFAYNVIVTRWQPHHWPNQIISPSHPPKLYDLIQKHTCPYWTAPYIWTPPRNYKSEFPSFRLNDIHHRTVLEKWVEAGPPPLSEYRLTFGKYKKKKLEEVPDDYLFGFLIKRGRGKKGGYCPLLKIALEDYMRRVPSVALKAGLGKTEGIGEGVVSTEGKVGKGRMSSKG